MRRAALVGIALVIGCGSRTAPGSADSGPGTDGARPRYDATCETEPPTRTDPPCGPLRLRHGTEASCAISLVSCDEGLDGEAFQPATCSALCSEIDLGFLHGGPARVLAMNRCGDGHVVGWCDSTTLVALMRELRLRTYLGGFRVAVLGTSYPCNPDDPIPGWEPVPGAYIGAQLPPEYVGAPDRLARDWDVVVFCPGIYPMPTGEETETLLRFVREEGKGVLIAMDYGRSAEDIRFQPANAITAPCGFSFVPVTLDWTEATADLACVPDY